MKTHVTRIKKSNIKKSRIKTRKYKKKLGVKLRVKPKKYKKKYYGGFDFSDFFDLTTIDSKFFNYKPNDYSFQDFNTMMTMLDKFIHQGENYKTYFEGSILDEILKNYKTNIPIDFSKLPSIIQLILKLEIKPSNAIYFINYKFGYGDNVKKTNSLLDKIYAIEKVKKLIDMDRSESNTEDINGIDGWIVLSQILDLLIKLVGILLKENNIDITADYTKIYDALKDIIAEFVGKDSKYYIDILKQIIEYVKLIIADDNFIECGLLNYLLKKEEREDEEGPFHELYETIFKKEKDGRNPIKVYSDINRIEDFFIENKNSSGIMPPFILVLLSFRINPNINDLANPVMKSYHATIMTYMNKVNFCCSKDLCCAGICQNSNCPNYTKSASINPSASVDPSASVKGTTCDSVDISNERVAKVLGYLNYARRTNINSKMCPSLCSAINWNTFDPIFNLFTNISDFFTSRPVVQQFLFDTIIPYSTFLPLNINSYFNEVVYRKEDPYFDKKIEFFETEVLKAYEKNEYTNPICVPNKIMSGISKEWEMSLKNRQSEIKIAMKAHRTETMRREKEEKKLSGNPTRKLSFKSLFRRNKTKKNTLNSIKEESKTDSTKSVYHSAEEV